MIRTLSILPVEDDALGAGSIRDVLMEGGLTGFSILPTARPAEAAARLKAGTVDLVLLDLGEPGSQGMATLRELRQAAPGVPVIVLTGTDDLERGIAAMREGAQQWLLKGEMSGSLLLRVALYAMERQKTETREHLAREILEVLNRSQDLEKTIHDFLGAVKIATGFDAVGIRLVEGDDFPYYETLGFSGDFVRAERFLCAHDQAGGVVRDALGNPVLECMCGNILRGRTNPALPIFTAGGSFWTNSTTTLLATTTDADRLARTRNRCHGEGYESVALIPLRTGAEIIGLLQLNDHRPNRFTPGMIRFFEGLGASIGIALGRKQAEGMLRESRQRLDFALHGGALGSWDWFPQTGAVVYNDLWASMLEYAPAEVKPTVDFFKQHVHLEDLPAVIERLTGHLEGRTAAYESEHRLRTKSGKWKWVLDTGRTLVRDKEGHPTRVVGVVTDITGRKLAEAALCESQARLTRAKSFSHIMVAEIGLDGRWLEVPPQLCQLLDYTKAGLLARRLQDVTHPDDVESDWWQYQRLLASDLKSFSTEKRFRRRDGKFLWLDANVSLVTNDQGGPERFLTYLRDITEQKQAADRIREQAELLDLTHDAIAVLDLAGRILYWNKGAQRIFGWTADEAIGREFQQMQPEEEIPGLRTCLEQTLQAGTWNISLEKRTRAGLKVAVHSSWRLLKSAGGLPQAILIVETDTV
ncbi:MAG: PAS domain S-box protein [Verrucomicrobia bacterium]|nr:PAS domain S-box protein [Verrucomicrobiota bacterium]